MNFSLFYGEKFCNLMNIIEKNCLEFIYYYGKKLIT